MNSEMQKHRKRKRPLLTVLLTLLASSSCAHGLKATVCVVDSTNWGYRCVYGKNEFFVAFQDGKDLLCASPSDTELVIKMCKQHQIADVPLCKFRGNDFSCTDGKTLLPESA